MQHLIFCVKSQDTETALSLLRNKTIVDAVDSDGMAPLHYAALNNNLVLAKAIVAAGADLKIRDFKGQTPAHYIACTGNVDSLDILIDKYTELFSEQDNMGRTPLHAAAWSGNIDFFTFFGKVENSLDNINSVHCEGFTPFLTATRGGDVPVIQKLLKFPFQRGCQKSYLGWKECPSPSLSIRICIRSKHAFAKRF